MAIDAVTKFVLNGPGVAEMLQEQFVRDELTKRAARVLNSAEAGDDSFDYHIEQETTDRAVVRVGSDDEGVLFAESMTGNLIRAIDAGAT